MKQLCVSSIKVTYAFLTVLYLIVFPFGIYLSGYFFPKSFIAKIDLPIILYLLVVGILYLISTVYTYRSKRIGFVLGVVASYMGVIPWIGSILGGGYLFLHKEIKKTHN